MALAVSAGQVSPYPRPAVSSAGAGIQFVRINAGSFEMGCSPGDRLCFDEEKPVHSVRISRPFEIGKYEVTQAQWEAVMGNNPSEHKGAKLPVERVNWGDVHEFLDRLNRAADGYRYRLPTEAEWEYAARAGTTGRFSGSLEAMAWCGLTSGELPHEVGTRQANPWGLHDMHGNVWEWCQDWADEHYYRGSPALDPAGPASGKYRVIRGGSWGDSARTSRVSLRHWVFAETRQGVLGFRCVREPVRRQGE
jgi:formylglycine-generating enzyme required for sulfatase activity